MKKVLRAFIYSFLLGIIALFSVARFWLTPFYLTIILIIISILMLAVWWSKEDLVLYAVCGFAGAMAEAFAV